jgi:hypothetical protein
MCLINAHDNSESLKLLILTGSWVQTFFLLPRFLEWYKYCVIEAVQILERKIVFCFENGVKMKMDVLNYDHVFKIGTTSREQEV